MTFDIDNCYTALNAHKLKAGDIVITADTYQQLVQLVKTGKTNGEIFAITDCDEPFTTTAQRNFQYAYLLKR